MLVQIYTILSLLVFMILVFTGSMIDLAMLKGVAVFSILIVLTRVSSFLLDIISETPPKNKDAKTSPQS